jgi:hypothetical protein
MDDTGLEKLSDDVGHQKHEKPERSHTLATRSKRTLPSPSRL